MEGVSQDGAGRAGSREATNKGEVEVLRRIASKGGGPTKRTTYT